MWGGLLNQSSSTSCRASTNLPCWPKIAVAVHIGYEDKKIAAELLHCAQMIQAECRHCDIYITAVHEEMVQWAKREYPDVTTFLVENRGVDVLGFLHILKRVSNTHHYIFKLHTKSDLTFRRLLLHNFIADRIQVRATLQILLQPGVGMVLSKARRVEPVFVAPALQWMQSMGWPVADVEKTTTIVRQAQFSGGAFFAASVSVLWRGMRRVDTRLEALQSPVGRGYALGPLHRLYLYERLWGICAAVFSRQVYCRNEPYSESELFLSPFHLK